MKDMSRTWGPAILTDLSLSRRDARHLAVGQTSALQPVPRSPRLPAALAERLRGPGGYYNIGNVIGLAMGVGIQLASMPDAASGSRLWAFFAGSPSACAMTIATIVFIASGEVYHRAWNGGRPIERLNRIADLLSGIGAIVLGLALFMLGHPMLAAVSGLLSAAGKLGSAAVPRLPRTAWPHRWPDPFRSAVVVSRLPAMLVSVGELWIKAAAAIAGGPLLPALTPATLLVCYLLWAKADLLLFEDDQPATPRQASDAGDPPVKP